MVKLLSENNTIDVNKETTEKKCKTPLIVACVNGHIEVVKVLLENKAIDLNKGINKKTPLSFTMHHQHNDIVDILAYLM